MHNLIKIKLSTNWISPLRTDRLDWPQAQTRTCRLVRDRERCRRRLYGRRAAQRCCSRRWPPRRWRACLSERALLWSARRCCHRHPRLLRQCCRCGECLETCRRRSANGFRHTRGQRDVHTMDADADCLPMTLKQKRIKCAKKTKVLQNKSYKVRTYIVYNTYREKCRDRRILERLFEWWSELLCPTQYAKYGHQPCQCKEHLN